MGGGGGFGRGLKTEHWIHLNFIEFFLNGVWALYFMELYIQILWLISQNDVFRVGLD